MSEEVEEIVALLQKFPLGFSNTIHWAKKDEWFKEFKPQVEALLEDHVSRAQLKKLHNDLRQIDTTLNDEYKVILDEIERGCYSNLREIYDRMFNVMVKHFNEVLERLEAVTGDTKPREVKQ
jgi:hypothetical protein